MAPIVVDPDALAGAGESVTGVGDELSAAVGTLASSLDGGAPSGLDAAGLAFGMAYQKSAQALLDAGTALVNASRNVGFGVGMSATNYSKANVASTIGGGAAPLTAPEKPSELATPSSPPSLGGGVPPPFLWSVLQSSIPDTWPDGDPGRLRASAEAWQTFATAITGIAGGLSGPAGLIASQQIPEGGAMASAMSELSRSLSDVATEAGNLATQTREFADDVQSTQDAIRDLCDRVSPSGIFDGIKAVFSGDALDEIKEIADDVKEVLENFGRQADGRIAFMESLITALDSAVVSMQQSARREFTHYLGDDVGGALASAFEFQSNVGEGAIKAGLESIVGVQQLDPVRFASDPDGATAAWGGVLDTLKYATPSGVAADPAGAFDHGKDMAEGIVHAEDWRADRPGLGLGGVLFEAGSAATGVGAAKTGLRGAGAAADAGDTGPAVRAAAGTADATAPIAGRASDIASKLEDLTTLADDVPSGAASGADGPALPPSLAEPDTPRNPDAPQIPESGVPQQAPHNVPDAATPRPAELPSQPVPDAGVPSAEVPSQALPEAGPSRAIEPGPGGSTVAAPDAPSPPVASTHAVEPMPSASMPVHAAEPPSTGAGGTSHGSTSAHSTAEPSSSSIPRDSHASEPRETAPLSAGAGAHPRSEVDVDNGSPDGPPLEKPVQDGVVSSDEVGRRGLDETVRTDALRHPYVELLDASELDAARESPTRVTAALAEGLPSSDPRVMAIVPEDFDKYGGMSKEEWETQYWPSGETDNHGNPKLTWPDPRDHPEGFLTPEDRRPAVLQPGSSVDRFGPGFGRFVSPEGTPFTERGLPYSSLDDGYHRYEVVKALPVWEGPIAPAMGQAGGGIQYYLLYSVVDLLIAGYIREVT